MSKTHNGLSKVLRRIIVTVLRKFLRLKISYGEKAPKS